MNYLTRTLHWRFVAPVAALALIGAKPIPDPMTAGIKCRITTSLHSVTAPAPGYDADSAANAAADAAAAGGGAAGGGGGGAGGGGGGGGGGGAGGGRGGGGGAGGRGGGAPRGPAAGFTLSTRMVLSAQIVNGQGRVDVAGTITGADLSIDQYLIASDTDETVVNMGAKTYEKRTLNESPIVTMVQALNNHELVALVHVDFDTLKGETIEGLPTRHYQLKYQYQLWKPDSLNEMKPATNKVTSDFWVADVGVHFRNPFVGFARPKDGYSPGLKVWVQKLADVEDVINKGLVIKFTSNSVVGVELPQPVTSTRTMDITGITQADIDPSSFQVPGDFKLTKGRGGGGG